MTKRAPTRPDSVLTIFRSSLPTVLDFFLLPARLTRIVWRALRSDRLGECPVCHTSVFRDDEHVRYRGTWFHREPCSRMRPAAEAYERSVKPSSNGYRLPFLP